MKATQARWAGVDVGACAKGFHLALVDRRRLIAGPERRRTPDEALELLVSWAPRLVAVDSPLRPAPDGLRSRPCEREFARARICGLRFTPDQRTLASSRYYEWILNGFALYRGLTAAGLGAIECFPTASWTCWYRPRRAAPRGAWSAAALRRRPLAGVPRRLDQDERDAIAAALTAREHALNLTERFGDLVIPRRPPPRVPRAGHPRPEPASRHPLQWS
jgi:predicted nuclease with RNAse H fold